MFQTKNSNINIKSGYVPDKNSNINIKSGCVPDKNSNINIKSGYVPDRNSNIKYGYASGKILILSLAMFQAKF